MLFNIKKYFGIIILVLIAVIPLFGLLNPGLPLTHDGPDHVIRGANNFINLSDGNLIPRWAPNVNYGFGHPVLMFFYPLPYYLISVFHFLGFSFIDSTKLVFGISYLLSGLAMYLWVQKFLGKTEAAFAGLLYMFAPYRFIDLYVRGAIGEHMAFIFPPLICYFLLLLSKRYSYKYIFAGAFSVAGLILSHNAISIMFLPIVTLYGAYLFWQSREKQLFCMRFITVVIFGFSLSAFFWIPAFFESKYTLVNVVTGGREFASSFVNINRFIYGQWSYGGTTQMSMQIGVVHWISVVGGGIAFLLLRKKNKPFAIFIAGTFGIFLGAVFIMTQASAFIWDAISLLPKFQFPWRFLTVVVFTSSVLGGSFLFLVKQKMKTVVFAFLIALLLFANKDFWQIKGYLKKDDVYFSSVTRTTTNDTGESSPIWSIRFMEQRPSARIEVLTGEATISEISRTSTYHVYSVNVLSNTARIVENTLYFPGWNVYVNNTKTNIEFQDPLNRGLMTFYLPEGENKVEIKFEDTGIRKGANLVTVVSFIVLFSLAFVFRSKGGRKHAKFY